MREGGEETGADAPGAGGGDRPSDRGVRDLIVVGIGASAGGLNACRRLVAGLPVDPGMAFILIQHLDPTHESMMAPLLARHSAMPVRQATDGMPLEGGAIHIIPPGAYLSLRDGALRLTAPEAPHGARLPFDFLLHTLATECGPRAVCIVLSGTGADGSMGLRSVRAQGGLVIVEDPDEAEYSGMPLSAIATGMVNLVRPVAQIPEALAAYAHGELAPAPVAGARPDDTRLGEIIAVLREGAGHDFSLYKHGTLRRRIARRMALGGLNAGDLGRYLEILRDDAHERDLLARDLLIHVTSFFRDPKVFDQLTAIVAPDLIAAQPPERPLRIWVAGCSTGEETYSLAMIFFEALAKSKSRLKLQILASDVDPDSVAAAREGVYPATIAADVSPERLERFFVSHDAGYRVSPMLRDAVVFTVQDLLSDPPFSRIDLVSCRNLMIYLSPEAQARAVALFHFALRPGGVLLIGGSETIAPSDDRFEAIDKLSRIYRRVGRNRPGEVAFLMAGGARAPAPPPAALAPKRAEAIGEICKRLVFEAYAPTAVLINRRFECLHFLGQTDRYLRIAPGPPSLDFLSVTPKALRHRIRAAAHRCFETRTLATVTGGEIPGDADGYFSIDLRPVTIDHEDLILACFVTAQKAGRKPKASDGASTSERISEIEAELETTKGELRDAIQTLEASNEAQSTVNAEALSVNEEFQSTNEELLASKEELQSLNEELTALNSQLQETLERQRGTASDLQNVLYSTDIATLFLDRALNIRFFTPATKVLFRIIPGDIGRPLADLSALFADADLTHDATAVLEHVAPIDREIQGPKGAWFTRRIMPYRNHEDRVDGVVITFADITERKRAAQALIVARREAERANLAKSRFLAAASHDLRQPLQSLALIRGMLAKTVDDAPGRKLLTRFDQTLDAMSGMLNTLLDINQIEAGMVRPEVTDFPIAGVLGRLVEAFALVAQERGLGLRVSPCAAIVRTDARLLEQMLRNLISNALKYTGNGRVLIGCRRRGDALGVEVWDTGPGIADSELGAIFDEYHQVGNEARERSSGLGLGLSIVQRLGDLLGHRVSVRSRTGRGSVFAIDIPRAASGVAAAQVAAATPGAPAPEGAARGLILLVEDDQDVRELLEQLLLAEGYEVAAASDGVAAMQRVVRDHVRPALALIDYNLPNGLHGLEVAARLRERFGSGMPVIVLTGDISAATLGDVARRRCVLITKPVIPQNLLRSVADLLRTAPAPAPVVHAPAGGATVFVVDDDDALRTDLRVLLEDAGRVVEDYSSCEAFLDAYVPGRAACLLIDARLPGMKGIDLLRLLRDRGDLLPAVMITGDGDVGLAIEAMRAGASDFIEKPVGRTALLASVARAIEERRDAGKLPKWRRSAAASLDALTPRQRQIMEKVLEGRPNKLIAADLGISQRTVENHRAAVMKKTGAGSLPALARMALAAADGSA